MAFIGYPIDTPVSPTCISQDAGDNSSNNITYGEEAWWPDGNIVFCSYMKVVSGVQQIFVNKSYTGGVTWETPEQVTSGNYHKYGSSCCMDVHGCGLHLVYSACGYGATAGKRANQSIIYQFRDADGVWSIETIIQLPYTASTWNDSTHPCIALDSSGNVHLVYSWGINFSIITGRTVYVVVYRKYNGVDWNTKAAFLYGGNEQYSDRPNIQVDYYGNPHVVMHIKQPTPSFYSTTYSTVWIANLQQGHIDGWPGTRPVPAYPWYCKGWLSDTINSHVLCTKLYTGTPPSSFHHPSYYCRLSLSHSSVGDNCYYDGANEYDYPHCVYDFNYGDTIYTVGTYYTWKDDSGWHDELISASPSSSPSPSIAINPDGKIHTIIQEPVVPAKYDYRQRVTYDEMWGAKVSISELIAPRQLVQRYPVQYPMDVMQCSPFIAVQGSSLKFFKCPDVVTGYGYFM